MVSEFTSLVESLWIYAGAGIQIQILLNGPSVTNFTGSRT